MTWPLIAQLIVSPAVFAAGWIIGARSQRRRLKAMLTNSRSRFAGLF